MKKQLKIKINTQLAMLCELLDTTPETVIQEFINNLSLDHKYTSGSDERRMAADYFVRVGYGMHRFTVAEVYLMFDDLNSIRLEASGHSKEEKQQSSRKREKMLRAFYKEWKAEKAKKIEEEKGNFLFGLKK